MRFGVSHENVQATIDTPSNHHGMFLPERKNASALFEDFLIPAIPMPMNRVHYHPIDMTT